ncbi:MAG TPA: response regulator [Alphaproteobacteria bacterium]|nr:response regulator [Alphaproteobacteria bacterium]
MPGLLESPPPADGRRRFLLVDDDAITREIVAALLHARGFAVDAVGTGAAGIERFRQDAYDAVLLDNNLPDMPGYVVANALRNAQTGGRRARMLAFSASMTEAEQARLRAAGVDGCLAKPLDEASLAAALEPGSGVPARDVPAAVPLVDTVAVRMLTAVVGADRAQAIQDQFWAEWPDHVTRLCSLRLDRSALAALAHRLTALAGNCGYLRLSLLCRDLSVAAGASPDADVTDDLIGRVLDLGDQTRAAAA